jgi:hypothetical protein
VPTGAVRSISVDGARENQYLQGRSAPQPLSSAEKWITLTGKDFLS